ncbi:MAG: DUF1707 domain-containing protein [Propionibacteriaceae bacterium]|nr:DUF1707 domain-containing protein [Propionibacteriaceae bacterium]
MDNPGALEPSDVGPLVGGNQPVSATDRELVRQLLDAAAGQGRLDPADYSRRVELAARAVTFDDLIPLTRDLQALSPGPALSPIPLAPTRPGAEAVAADDGQRLNLVGLFSGFDRRGPWLAPGSITAWATFGGGEIDLRQAIWAGPVIELTVTAVCGGVDIKAPLDTEVVNQVVSVFGGATVSTDGRRPAGPRRRRLIVKGFCAFGGVTVKLSD